MNGVVAIVVRLAVTMRMRLAGDFRGHGGTGRFYDSKHSHWVGFVSRAVLGSWMLAILVPQVLVSAPPPRLPANAQDDATLRGVWFVDSDRGWAVGDRGVIWRTVDGGRSWHIQPSGVTCRLDDVAFSPDGRVGCIVGGWCEPHTGQTRGVVLRSTDGGETWNVVPAPTLPLLFKVSLPGADELYALTAASPLYPSGLLRSTDGGRSWNAVPAGPLGQVTCGDFAGRLTGAVATEDGRLLSIVSGRASPARTASVGMRSVRAIALRGQQGWLVGDGGLVMKTSDGGVSWQHIGLGLPDGVSTACDFYCVVTIGNRCWIAGSPGSIILGSEDGGKSWNVSLTGQTLPIRCLFFIDERRGWAVGELGTILGTRDGGRTWWTMRSGGDRLAGLGVWSLPESTPWEWLAWYGADQGYLIGWLHIHNRWQDLDRSGLWIQQQRLQDALIRAGVTSTDIVPHFPVPPRGIELSEEQLVELWNRVHDGNASEPLLRYLVRQLRMARPDVVIVPQVPLGSGQRVPFIHRLVLRAVEQAADATGYPELAAVGLRPWQVQRIVAVGPVSDSVSGGEYRVAVTQLSAQLGAAVDDFVRPVRGLIGDCDDPPQAWAGTTIVDQNPGHSPAELFGTTRVAGERVRREAVAPCQTDLRHLSQTVQQSRRAIELVRRLDTGLADGSGNAQLATLASPLPASSQSVVLAELAKRQQRLGHWEAAAETYQKLLEQFPDDELGRQAAAWLVAYYSSGEVTWQLQRMRGAVVIRESSSTRTGTVSQERPVRTALSIGTHLPSDYSATARARQALDFTARITDIDPVMYHDPTLRLPWSVAQRAVGQGREAQSYIDWLAVNGLSASWRATGQAEQWLRHGQGLPPKPVAVCIRAATPPYLDGDLSDDVWQQAASIELHSPLYDDANWPASVQLASDDQFLYVAARVHRTARDAYGSPRTVRTRDADLKDRDRIQILIDIDRDYTTYYLLEVDCRGWAADQCWNSPSWDPEWYIASRDDGTWWTLELAIGWQELVAEPPKPNAAWAVQFQRIAPKTGFQAWSTPADTQPIPEGFGVLVFR
ncbi:MAG: hypothetical protein KatS3mg110_0331 [Pirellulaceae bacterium]|nr:MAG: hypothetical protein KatS3mg110_0331 [Pirellulaceae bacterium]